MTSAWPVILAAAAGFALGAASAYVYLKLGEFARWVEHVEALRRYK